MHFSFENKIALFFTAWRHSSSNNGCHMITWHFALNKHGGLVVVKAASRLTIFLQVFSVGLLQHLKCGFLWSNFNSALFRNQLIVLILHWWIGIFYWISRVCVDQWLNEVKFKLWIMCYLSCLWAAMRSTF